MTTSTITREYLCPHCGAAWQSTVRITAPVEECCPQCKRVCRPQLQPAEIVFRGAGWTPRGNG